MLWRAKADCERRLRGNSFGRGAACVRSKSPHLLQSCDRSERAHPSDPGRRTNFPGLSVELCGGTHVRNTAEIALFKIVSETGVAAGVRRIEAVTGRGALALFREHERELKEIELLVRAPAGQAVKRVQSLVEERRALEKRLDESMRSGGGGTIKSLVDQSSVVDGVRVVAASVAAPDLPALQAMGDALRDQMGSGVGVLAGGKGPIL